LAWFGREDWEIPFGQIVEGVEVLEEIYTGYGDMAEMGGGGPSQHRLAQEGNAYAQNGEFPDLDYIVTCDIVHVDDEEL
jgi:peptidyl-prolyl cis-trans isomerase A (cyclophilin A)